MKNALRVILAIHGEDDFRFLNVVVECCGFLLSLNMPCVVGEFFEVDAHRECADLDAPILYYEASEAMLIAYYALNAAEEILGVIVGVKTNKVSSKQALQDLPAPCPRQQSKNLKLGKRNMQKKADPHLRQGLAQQIGQEHQVIIMYPDRIVRADCFEKSCVKGVIDLSILRPIFLVVFGK